MTTGIESPPQATAAQAPIAHLWSTVRSLSGPALDWHLNDLYHHELRYLADFALVAGLAPVGSILEVGSAPCHMTSLLTLAGYATVGVDLRPERVAEIIDRLHLDVRMCDIERAPLPFAEDAFACALLCETFEHLRIDPAFVLSEINRVLAPGAALILTTPNVYSLPGLARFLLGRSVADPSVEFGKLRGIGHMGHVREYSAREVARFLQTCGFAIHFLGYRHHKNKGGWKRKLLRVAYLLAPRQFHREIVIVARKISRPHRLSPLVPVPVPVLVA